MPKTTTTPAPEPKPRRRWTDREKAQDALDVVARKVKRLDEQIAAHVTALAELRAERTPLERRREFLATDPALEQPSEPAVFFGDHAVGEAQEIPAEVDE